MRQELQPERLAFIGPDVEAQDVPVAAGTNANGGHDCLAHNAVVLPHLEIERIQPDVWKFAIRRMLLEGYR